MVPAFAIGSGPLTLLVFVALGAFVVLGWYSLRRNLRGIDFNDRGSRPSGEPGPTPVSPDERSS